MNKIKSDSNKIKVEIIVRDGCNFSYETLKSLLLLRDDHPEMMLSVVNIDQNTDNRRTIGGITPSIWVNNKLWFLGSFSSEKFQTRLSALVP